MTVPILVILLCATAESFTFKGPTSIATIRPTSNPKCQIVPSARARRRFASVAASAGVPVETTNGKSIDGDISGAKSNESNAKNGSEGGNDGNDDGDTAWTIRQLEEFAKSDTVGVILDFETFGGGMLYRCVAKARHDESIVLGYVEGFLRPPPQIHLVHMDKMVVYQHRVNRVKRATDQRTLQFGGVSIGLGLLMGYRCLLYAIGNDQINNRNSGHSRRTTVEFLAINDEDFQHKRLVKYYRYAGFNVVRYVGDDIGSIPDRMLWGGCGTLMTQNIRILMIRWTRMFQLMERRKKQKHEET